MKKKLLGATLAATAALVFAVAPVSSTMAAKAADVKCIGGNACKGQSTCKGPNGCDGKNACKGKGVMMTKSKKACEKAGGTVAVEKEAVKK